MGDGEGGELWLNWHREITINLQEELLSFCFLSNVGGELWLNWHREITINLQEVLLSFCFLSNVDWL